MKNLPSQFTLSFLIKSLMLVAIFLSLESIARAVGGLDPTFGTNGRVTTNISDLAEARAVVVQPDGKIVVVGFARLNGSIDPAVVRYNSNGSLDTEFGSGGIVQTLISPRNDYFGAVALQPDGKIVAVGFTGRLIR